MLKQETDHYISPPTKLTINFLEKFWFCVSAIGICVIIVIPFSIISIILITRKNVLIMKFANRNNNIGILRKSENSIYDLRSIEYRNNGSLYRFRNQYVILKNEKKESFENIILTTNTNEVDGLISLIPHEESTTKGSYVCSGTCECYGDEWNGENRRSVRNLIYSYRFTSILVISAVGFAAGKFVNDHLDHCYEMARKFHGTRKSTVSCSVEDVDCDDLENQVKRAYCIGHCIMDEKRFKRAEKEGLESDEEWAVEDCEDKYQSIEVIEVPIPFEKYTKKADPRIISMAKLIYGQKFLHPYCMRVNFILDEAVRLCRGDKSTKGSGYDHIFCSYDKTKVESHRMNEGNI